MSKVLLSVAGYDPTSGAGVSLDLKVFEFLGFHGIAILTSATSQNTKYIKQVHCLPPEFLWDQYQALCQDLSISGIKIGMVGCEKNIHIIKQIIADNPDIPLVIDPVFRSSSGTWLLEKEAIPFYMSEISGKVSLLTPNLDEAFMISGIKIENMKTIKEAAQTIFSHIKIPCLIKGGNFEEQIIDVLYDGNSFHFFKKEKIKKNVHGTGCFFSSILLGYLVRGISLEEACFHASQLTRKAIKDAVQIGNGQHIISPLLQEENK